MSCFRHSARKKLEIKSNRSMKTVCITCRAPDPEIFGRGGLSLAVIYSITNFLFLIKLYKIIEPRLLEERG